jgi:hypothetical protein
MMAVDSLMHVINIVSAMDNTTEASVMQALPTMASLAAKGAAARALLAAGAAAAVAETMLAHRVRRPCCVARRYVPPTHVFCAQDNAGLLCEACTVLCVLAGGLLSPLGLSADAVARERTIREAMCDRVASHAGVVLIKMGSAHADDQWVALAVARALGVVGRGTVAAHRLLDFGAVPLLARALARYADDSSAYEAAHMSALAMVALAATCPQNADSVDQKGGRAALQRAALANTALARAMGMEYPHMAGWLAGRATARCDASACAVRPPGALTCVVCVAAKPAAALSFRASAAATRCRRRPSRCGCKPCATRPPAASSRRRRRWAASCRSRGPLR